MVLNALFKHNINIQKLKGNSKIFISSYFAKATRLKFANMRCTILQKPRGQLSILSARRVTRSRRHVEEPHILGATLQALLQIPSLKQCVMFLFISYADNFGFRFGLQWCKVRAKFRENRPNDPKVEIGSHQHRVIDLVLSSFYEGNVGYSVGNVDIHTTEISLSDYFVKILHPNTISYRLFF